MSKILVDNDTHSIPDELGGQHNTREAVAYSDSFFPFTDAPRVLIEAGIKTILATRGSIKDEEVKQFCLDHQTNFITLPDSLARGFFGH